MSTSLEVANAESIQLPQIRWIQRTIREISGKINTNDRYEMPWSIGISQEYGISPDSTRLLLDIQRWCSSIGYTFTLHEAMWTHTLKTIIPASLTIEEIHNWVKLYSAREKTCKILERQVDTRDMDYFLNTLGPSDYTNGEHITPWTYFTLMTVNKIKPFHAYTRKNDVSSKTTYMAGWGDPAVKTVTNLKICDSEEDPSNSWIVRRLEALTDYESREVYSLWLNYISKAPYWADLTQNQRVDIADRLIKWVYRRNVYPVAEWSPDDILEETGHTHKGTN